MSNIERRSKRAGDDDLIAYVRGLIENARDKKLANAAWVAFQAVSDRRRKRALSKGLIRALRVFEKRERRLDERIRRENEIGEIVEKTKKQLLNLNPPVSSRADNQHGDAYDVVALIVHKSRATVYKAWLRYNGRNKQAGL
jgi:hypothetical protein